MNLIIISLAIIGAITLVSSIAYELLYVNSSPLWARALATALMLGGYVGFIALIMFFLGMPLS